MTDAAPASSPAPAASTRPAWQRYLWIGVPLVVVLIVLLLVFWPRIRISFSINALNADDPRTLEQARKDLVAAEREDWVDEMLVEAVEDSDRSFRVRRDVVGVLSQRNRLPLVERAYLDGSVDTRSVILSFLAPQQYFHKEYADNERFQVRQTLKDWLARKGDRTRVEALPIVMALGEESVLPDVRPMLTREDDPREDPVRLRRGLIGAIRIVAQFRDCDAGPQLLHLAENDPDGYVRASAFEALTQTLLAEDAGCEAPPAGTMERIVPKLLEDERQESRIKSLFFLEKNPRYAALVVDELMALTQPGAGDEDGIQRRHALQVLVAMKHEPLIQRFMETAHDALPYVRATFAQYALRIPEPRMESGLIGLVDRETSYLPAWRGALDNLRAKAGRWIGLSEAFLSLVREDPLGFRGDMERLFGGAEVHGIKRQALVEAWFRWFATDLGLTPEETKTAWEARVAFWKAAEAGDAAAARAALEVLPARTPGLFAYEEAWLASRA